MSSNAEVVINNYGDGSREDMRSTFSRASNIEFYYIKKFLSEYINHSTSIIEIGCATGFYGMYFADKCKDYLGVDITPANIQVFNDKITSNKLENVKTMVGDATNLNELKNDSFDVVMALGPMYHLPFAERELVFEECKRICKKDGIIIFAYINKVGAYIKGCLLNEKVYPNKEANDCVLKNGINDIRPDLFFFTTPEEMEKQAIAHGLGVIKNVGVDFTFNEKQINNMTDEQFEAWMELSDFISDSPSCTGFSDHALLICKNDDMLHT